MWNIKTVILSGNTHHNRRKQRLVFLITIPYSTYSKRHEPNCDLGINSLFISNVLDFLHLKYKLSLFSNFKMCSAEHESDYQNMSTLSSNGC